ncbi:MAG: alginate biosynthesis protein AlgX [Pseudomonadota bacterium]
MTHNLLRRAVLLACLVCAPAKGAEAGCDLQCLICPALDNPQEYAEGVMKSMKVVAPGKDTWLFRSEVDLSNIFGIPPAMQGDYARLMRTFAAKNIQVVFAVQPTRGLMHRDKILPGRSHGFDYAIASRNLERFLGQLRRGGAVVADIMPLVRTPPEEEYFFRRDHHWTLAGSRATAQIVADEIKRQPVYAGLTKKSYRTEAGGMLPKDGTMNRAMTKICGNNYGFQYVRGFQTVPAGDDASALFEEETAPQVVLVGTSNSAARDDEMKNYNFEGYLKEFLSVDILNFALPGSGQDGALLQYLQSGSYKPDAPPKLLIWELPASYHLDGPLTYRQLIPAINGGCAASPQVLASNTLKRPSLVPGQRIELLSNSGTQRQTLVGRQAFLDIKLSDKSLKDFYILTYYDNGARDKAWFRREAIVDGGQFYLELSQAAELRDANLLSVFLEPVQPLDTPIAMEVKLCL